MSRVAPPSSVLGRLLEAAGYRIEGRGEATLAVRTNDHRAVLIVPATRSPAEVDRWFPGDAIHRTLVYDDDPGGAARALAADRGIEVLEPSTLGAALAELLLPAPREPARSSESGLDDAGLFPPLAVLPDGERIVRPRIGRAEAESLAGIDASRYTLRLVPFYVAPYRVRPSSPYGAPGAVLHRLVAVNAVSRRAEVWEEADRELVAEVDEPHQRLLPQLGESQAVTIATETIRRHHTVDVEHTEQHGGALVIETRRILPSSDDLRLGPMSLLYVPYWYAEGTDGRVVLDAVTGRRAATPDGAPG
ncbi:MAG TPA: hypothetical protein VMC82_00955 [Thermoplasmata archaeon]|nr:hypothetical protein [Thermoplasmata archaeon]HTZ61205.1 hypothetical protein [Thermoplasmata archaeon]